MNEINLVKPIKPNEILGKKLEVIPSEMIQAVNELIALKWKDGSSTIRQDELLAKYFELSSQENNRTNRDTVFDNNYLEIEEIYGDNGWNVRYSKPDYRETAFEPYFTFTVKK